jgi:putative ABC transport system ATP-binding protein
MGFAVPLWSKVAPAGRELPWAQKRNQQPYLPLLINFCLARPLSIRTQALCRHYQMGSALIRAVDGINLEIRAGEFVALLGASGSGKSSLLNLLAGLDSPSAGSVFAGDRDLAGLSREELAKYRRYTVGMVFQSFNLIPSMTVLENVELPLRFAEVERAKRGAMASNALQKVGLTARLEHRPIELSGGEQQRVALARALINKPAIVLADEPTGNLDSKNSDIVLGMLRHSNQELGQTVLMITHNPEAASYGDRIIHMRDGQIAA